jgi:hypothetical protein
MENMTHTYRGTEYNLVIDGEFWFLDCSAGEFNGTLPVKSKEVNQAIRDFKKSEAIKKANAPKCKVCKKDPTEIIDYKYAKDPIQFVRENERFCGPNQFYCSTCYIKAGMPLF